MEYRRLGRTGMQVSPLCLGAMMFGAWGEPDHDTSIRIIHRALDAGINFIDTADVYSQGESEVIVGKALAGGRRDDVILATKFHGQMGVADGPAGRRPEQARQLAPLDHPGGREQPAPAADRLDRPLPGAPARTRTPTIEETLSALTDLQRQGKIRAFGSSTFPAHEVVEAQWTARARGLGRFVTEQPPYSILVRGIEADLLPVAQRYGMGVLPWSPLAGGWLTGRYRKGQDDPDLAPCRDDAGPLRPVRPRQPAQAGRRRRAGGAGREGRAVAGPHGAGLRAAHPAVTAPIIGPRTMEQLESQLGAADVTLSTEVLDRIDEIVPPGVTLSRGDTATSRRHCRTRSCGAGAPPERGPARLDGARGVECSARPTPVAESTAAGPQRPSPAHGASSRCRSSRCR